MRFRIPIRLTDRFETPRRAVVGWNRRTAGYEIAVAVFDRDIIDAGTGRFTPAVDSECRLLDSQLLDSWSQPTRPTVVPLGFDRVGVPAAPPVVMHNPAYDVRPGSRQPCLTVDSLIDALRFEGFRIDATDTERLSELADAVERCRGPVLLRGRRSTANEGRRLRLRVEHPDLPTDAAVFDGRSGDGSELMELGRRIIELCWTQRWTAAERDLTLAFTLDVLADVQDGFCFSASDIALWCLTGSPVPNRPDEPGRSDFGPVPGQLQLALGGDK